MYSELLRIPIEWHGIPIFGFGVVLALWLAFSAWGMRLTARDAGWSAAMWAHLPTVLIVAVGVAVFIPQFFSDGVPIRGYGLMVLLGSVTGIGMAIYRARQVGVSADEIVGVAVAMFLCGVVGARLFWIIEYWDNVREPTLLATIKSALSITEGGLVVYGAFIGAMIGFTWHVHRRGLPKWAMSDVLAPCMLAGLAFGRIGCLLNGCCYGGESTAPWAVTFPRHNAPGMVSAPFADQAVSGRLYGFSIVRGSERSDSAAIGAVQPGSAADTAGLVPGDLVTAVFALKEVKDADEQPPTPTIEKLEFPTIAEVQKAIIDAIKLDQPLKLETGRGEVVRISQPARSLTVHPAQIYSSINAGLLAWLLWSFYPFRRREGQVTALMLTLYPIARFFEEWIRIDEPNVFGTGLSISQNISLLLLGGAVVLWAWLQRRPAGALDFPLSARA